MRKSLTRALAVLLTLANGVVAVVVADGPCETCIPPAAADLCVSCENKACTTYAKPGTVEKHCWVVECEEICIPAIRWPWQCGAGRPGCVSADCVDGCSPIGCGHVRTVRKLVKKTYECDTCEYERRIESRRADCCPTATAGMQNGVVPATPVDPSIPSATRVDEPTPAPPLTPPGAAGTAVDVEQHTSLWSILTDRSNSGP